MIQNVLNITESKADKPIISRMKKTLRSRFRPNSDNDRELALRLSHYLLADGKAEESKALLQSFLYFDINEKEEHLWFWNSYGIILLAYLEKLQGNSERFNELVTVVEGSDFFQVEEPQYYFEDLDDKHGDYDFHIVDYLNETHKFRCQILSQLFINYLFFFVMQDLALSGIPEKMKVQMAIINRRMGHLHSLLQGELSNKR